METFCGDRAKIDQKWVPEVSARCLTNRHSYTRYDSNQRRRFRCMCQVG